MAPLKLRQDWKIWYRRVVQLCLIQKPSAEIFKSLQKKEEKIYSATETPKIILHLIWRVARSELCPLGMQAAPGSIPMSGTFFGHEKKSTAILPLPLIQVEQLSVTGERMCTKYW